MGKLTLKEKKDINKFVSLFPSRVTVKVHRSECGKFCAEILTFTGCFTEASTFYELIEMINDAIRTYFEIPEKYLSFMPEYLATIEMAQHFKSYPVVRKPQTLDLININAGIKG
jgi:predicted RNase H-like HicB family nuclease